ncbi:MAG: YihY/virulence factor BrkB family protein [Acidimicrobiales bacterium]
MIRGWTRGLRAIDDWQQRRRLPAVVCGVVKKFGNDRGGMLAGIVTFYGFLSLFPMLLVAFTILGFVAGGPHSSLYRDIRTSALRDFPVVGDALKTENGLSGNGFALVAGLLGLLWGALGVTQAMQFAVDEAWDVPRQDRAAFFIRLAKGVAVLAVLGIGVAGTTVLTTIGTIVGNSVVIGAVGLVGAVLVNVALFLAVFRLLSPKHLAWKDIAPGAVLAGCGWQVLQIVGQSLVRHNLKHTTVLYGQFAIVLGMISFLSLAAQLLMYSVELNVVVHRRLWPRSLFEPQ